MMVREFKSRRPHHIKFSGSAIPVSAVCIVKSIHLGTAQMAKDDELRSLLRKRGYRVLELYYNSYSDGKRDQLYEEIRAGLTKLAYQSIVDSPF